MNNPFKKLQFAKHKKAIIITTAIVVLGFGAWFILRDYFFLPFDNRNFAEEVAKPIESALVKEGATKVCSQKDAGYGSDNRRPWVHDLYEVPGGKDAATALLRVAAKDSGFVLSDAVPPPNPEDNSFYSNTTSKRSTYSELKQGYVELIAEVYGSKAFSGDSTRCTVKSSSSANNTLVDITVTLPERK